MTNKEAIAILSPLVEQCKGTDGCLGYIEHYFSKDEETALDLAIKALEERPTGHWEKTGPNVYHCSHCGCVDSIGFANFCWLCGADMRGSAKQPSNGKEKKTLTEAFMEDINTDDVDYNELCYRTGHHLTMCDCEFCDHRHECSGYEGGTE